jgi:hypothetical protein
MKLVRFGGQGQERPGAIDRQGRVRDVSSHVSDWTGEALDPAWLAELSVIDIATFPAVSTDVRLGPPIPTPGKIICIGLNYADHAAETGFEFPASLWFSSSRRPQFAGQPIRSRFQGRRMPLTGRSSSPVWSVGPQSTWGKRRR